MRKGISTIHDVYMLLWVCMQGSLKEIHRKTKDINKVLEQLDKNVSCKHWTLIYLIQNLFSNEQGLIMAAHNGLYFTEMPIYWTALFWK